jgi:hypothetical protein
LSKDRQLPTRLWCPAADHAPPCHQPLTAAKAAALAYDLEPTTAAVGAPARLSSYGRAPVPISARAGAGFSAALGATHLGRRSRAAQPMAARQQCACLESSALTGTYGPARFNSQEPALPAPQVGLPHVGLAAGARHVQHAPRLCDYRSHAVMRLERAPSQRQAGLGQAGRGEPCPALAARSMCHTSVIDA